MPIFVSIDGSLDENDIATVSISIIDHDIHEVDNAKNENWQNRMARVLLIRSWQLPKCWGTGNTYINMAETLGFIIREYTTPSDLPIIYITDSKNERTLQRELKKSDELTHRKKKRQAKQDTDYSIANHLEMLTSKWQCKDKLTAYAKRLYKRGEEICYTWAMNKEHFSDDTEDNQNSQYGDFRRGEDASDISIKSGTTITDRAK